MVEEPFNIFLSLFVKNERLLLVKLSCVCSGYFELNIIGNTLESTNGAAGIANVAGVTNVADVAGVAVVADVVDFRFIACCLDCLDSVDKGVSVGVGIGFDGVVGSLADILDAGVLGSLLIGGLVAAVTEGLSGSLLIGGLVSVGGSVDVKS